MSMVLSRNDPCTIIALVAKGWSVLMCMLLRECL